MLILVVWSLGLLTVFTLIVGKIATSELQFGQWLKTRILTRSLAKAGIERAMMEIQADTFLTFDAVNESWASNDKAFKEMKMGEGHFSVQCEGVYGACDEAARINLNTATEPLLIEFLKVTNTDSKFTEPDMLHIAQSIIDWRDGDDAEMPEGAEVNEYKALQPPYEPRNAPFESVQEVMMVSGMTPEIYNRIKNDLTVYTDGKINFNTAPPIVLRSLGLSAELAEKVLEFRRGPDNIAGTKDDPAFQSVEGITPAMSAVSSFSGEEFAMISNAIAQGSISVMSNWFRIQSYGRLIKGTQFVEDRVTAVVDRKGSVLYWHEGEE